MAVRAVPSGPRPPRPLGARLLVALLLVLAPARAQGPAPLEHPDGLIVLVAGDALADASELAATLDRVAAGTGVVGPSRFAVRSRARAAPGELVELLDGLTDVRAVVAIVGDLGALDGVDPNEQVRTERRLSSRIVDTQALASDLDDLREHVEERLDARLVLATAPLGLQGAVEVPELVELAGWLRGHAASEGLALLDLAKHFDTLRPVPLFVDGVSRLDAFGVDEVVRALWSELLIADGALPARSDAARAARDEHRALHLWARGFDEPFEALRADVLARQPHDLAGQVRQAALAALGPDGMAAGSDRWQALPAEALPTEAPLPDVPGLALSLVLSGRRPDPTQCADPVEAELVRLVILLRTGNLDAAQRRADALVATHPHRLGAWIGAEFVLRARGVGAGMRGVAKALGSFRTGLPSSARLMALERDWVGRLAALPALMVRARVELELTPSGPVLEGARREARWGRRALALHILDRFLSQTASPPGWRAERERLLASKRAAPEGANEPPEDG